MKEKNKYQRTINKKNEEHRNVVEEVSWQWNPQLYLWHNKYQILYFLFLNFKIVIQQCYSKMHKFTIHKLDVIQSNLSLWAKSSIMEHIRTTFGQNFTSVLIHFQLFTSVNNKVCRSSNPLLTCQVGFVHRNTNLNHGVYISFTFFLGIAHFIILSSLAQVSDWTVGSNIESTGLL